MHAMLGIFVFLLQQPATQVPVAIVPMQGTALTGALDLGDGKAVIATSGSITAGDRTAIVTLPRRGSLHVCSTTKVSLTADKSVPVNAENGETPGLMMALERGALEASFKTGVNSDVILTPKLRITISGPGVASVQVRLGPHGDTCVDNRGPNAPYVSVTSLFDGGLYRVQGDQRVMFQQGSLTSVVDTEKESCGCPPDSESAKAEPNPFPVAQSEGLAPAPPAAANQPVTTIPDPLVYSGKPPAAPTEAKPDPAATVAATSPVPVPAAAQPAIPAQKPGFFNRLGSFFRKLFGG
jgi:hypothetical protein